ncbi:MAG: glycosyltransferase family 4 protein [Ferruginibacter sp.]
MDNHLHIVTHDVPWPADFGGVVDLFYKIKALHNLGIKIHLHCYTGGRPEQKILNKYCASVQYYQRKKGFASFSLRIPYIVNSRKDDALLKNLEKDNYPILLEGIHCTFFLQAGKLNHRKVFVRLHNVEYKYYEQLAKHETNIARKIYFKMESRLLKKYEEQLSKKTTFWAVSNEDIQVYKNELHAEHIHFMPVFLPWDEINSSAGKGAFCLYHGNLSINENEKAAAWLLSEVFKKINIPLTIAGKDPSPRLKALAAAHPHITLVENPSEVDMQELIKNAQINILPSFNNTGVKLKLLNALYNGRHCLVNKAAVEGSAIETQCTIASSANEFIAAIKILFDEPFTEEKMLHRNAALKDIYNTDKNARKLIAWIY